jgi:hypothetical protein
MVSSFAQTTKPKCVTGLVDSMIKTVYNPGVMTNNLTKLLYAIIKLAAS